MVLLGDVRELEVERERAQHARLPLERQRLDGLLELLVRRAGTRRAGQRAHPLDVLEQRLALLLDEDAPEQVAEQADVSAQRRLGLHGSSVGRLDPCWLVDAKVVRGHLGGRPPG